MADVYDARKFHIGASCLAPQNVERELVSRVHTLVGRSAQVVYELQVLEEEEKGREEVQEIERESQGDEKRSRGHDHVDEVKDSTLEPWCVCR